MPADSFYFQPHRDTALNIEKTNEAWLLDGFKWTNTEFFRSQYLQPLDDIHRKAANIPVILHFR